jgi:hypothetical protein
LPLSPLAITQLLRLAAIRAATTRRAYHAQAFPVTLQVYSARLSGYCIADFSIFVT